MTTGFTDREVMTTADGDRIVIWSRPVLQPRGVVTLFHGVGEHAGRYLGVVDALADAGYAVIAPDQLGHGATARLGAGFGALGVEANARVLRSMREVADLAGDRYPGVPLILIGHSWGSLLGQQAIQPHPSRGRRYAAVVLSGSTLAVPGFLNGGNLNAKYETWRTRLTKRRDVLAAARRGEPDNPRLFDWLSRDPAVAEAFASDPDTFNIIERPVWQLREGLQLLSVPACPLSRKSPGDIPILLLSGTEDALGFGARGPKALAAAYRRIGAHSDVTLRLYEGARHEVFQETNRAEVIADLVAWLNARFPVRSTGADAARSAATQPSLDGVAQPAADTSFHATAQPASQPAAQPEEAPRHAR